MSDPDQTFCMGMSEQTVQAQIFWAPCQITSVLQKKICTEKYASAKWQEVYIM